jgi:hypothetical protein
MAQRLTVRSDARGNDTYTHAGTGITVTHRTDALARICRKMVAFGMRGLAEVYGEDGRLRFTVPAVECTATRTLREGDRSSIRWYPHRAMPETVTVRAA